MTKGPSDIFFDWLSARADHARMAVAVDGDRLLAESGLLAKETITDTGGRAWRLVVFRGDDLTFRWTYRQARAKDRVLVVLARGTDGNRKIDVSYLADILAANEGGTPLDLSAPAIFKRLCPKINFPVAELRQFKDALLERVDAVPKAAEKIIERWGRPDDWGRGQLSALVLLSRHPDWVLSDIWPDELDPASAVAHGLRVLLSVPAESTDLPIIREMLQDAVRPQVKGQLFWFDIPVEQAAAYLLIRAFAQDRKLQNPTLQLAGLQIFPLEMPLDALEGVACAVIACLKAEYNAWPIVQQRAETFITPSRSAKIASLLPSEVTSKTVAELHAPVFLFPHLRQGLLHFFASPMAGLSWAEALRSHPACGSDGVESGSRRRQCRAVASLAQHIASIEARLRMAVPAFAHADALLEWYIDTGHHRLELQAARALQDLHACGDEDLGRAGETYLNGSGDETAPAAGSLGCRIRERLDHLDQCLAKFVAADPARFGNGSRSVVGFVKGELRNELTPILLGDSDARVWVLIFDGMRFDTWEDVVQPLLGQHFTITGQARFCVLPSYTQYARASLLAGSLPKVWAVGNAPSSRDEASLFASNIGLAANEIKHKLRLLTDAETTKARGIVGFNDKAARPLNILIYPISDTCHDYHGDLASFNNKIRREILGDPTAGIRGILDDLLKRIMPGDIVLATSDHGFVELPSNAAVVVGQAEAESHGAKLPDAVFYRYTKSFQPGQMNSVAIMAGSEQHYLCVGRGWLRREGVGTSVRYSHGGLSLSEVLVPAFRLERVTEKVAAVELTGLPVAIAVEEDHAAEVTFGVRNKGNMDAEFEVSVRTNLGEEVLKQSGRLSPASTRSLKFQVLGKYRPCESGEVDPASTLTAVEFRLRHTDQHGEWRDALDGIVNLKAHVQAKKTKLDSDALAGFDDV